MRKLVRLIAHPSPAHVAVWQECYWRWRGLSEFVLEPHPDILEESEKNFYTLSWQVRLSRLPVPLPIDPFQYLQEKHSQWRNLTLFLAAFGGTCVYNDDDLGSLTT